MSHVFGKSVLAQKGNKLPTFCPRATPVLPPRYPSATPVPPQYNPALPRATPALHPRYTRFTPALHPRNTRATPVLPPCFLVRVVCSTLWHHQRCPHGLLCVIQFPNEYTSRLFVKKLAGKSKNRDLDLVDRNTHSLFLSFFRYMFTEEDIQGEQVEVLMDIHSLQLPVVTSFLLQ